ncbi:restriction endonuclease subunit S [Pseudoalteromonas shioyasakiensis]|uniref:restriction endonuclease subunit S n=1 Tax=Pseudoalteromonas shioyasakiensis TaxID=1190813 RepID=UPI001C3D1950|nr:restriction endonuclease subunit S [Pseudoalteromonas shioyasakiensis]
MIQLNYLEKLLGGVDVEWLPLGNLAEIGTGKSNRQDETEDGEYPFYVRSKNILRSSTFQFDEKAIVVPGEGGIGDIFHFVEGKYALHQRAYRIKATSDVLDTKFLYHFMSSKFKQYILMKSVGATSISIRKPMLEGFQIPIPCPDNPEKSLAIQAEIVRILDAFTAMTAELTAELNLRKKQYNYYRDQLLSFDLSADQAGEGEVEWKTLGDVTKKWYSGGTPKAGNPEFYEYGDIPWLRTQEVKFADIFDTDVKVTPAALQNSSAKWIPENCVIIAISGATAGRSGVNKIPLTTNQHCGCLEIDDKKALYRYVFHWVSFNYENIKALGQGARGDLNSTIIKNFKLPVPYANDPAKSLAEQARIVAILDKFDTLTTSLQEGLPREIELRQKQYEYYRDLLLSFPKSEEAVA